MCSFEDVRSVHDRRDRGVGVSGDEFPDERGPVGEEVSAGEMYLSFAGIIAHVSRSETIYPDDVVGSGIIGGYGLGLDRFLGSGDTVRLAVEGIGTLENRVV